MSVNLAQLLVRSAHAYPGLPALARGARVTCTYAAARRARVARWLPGSRIAPRLPRTTASRW